MPFVWEWSKAHEHRFVAGAQLAQRCSAFVLFYFDEYNQKQELKDELACQANLPTAAQQQS